MPAIVRDASKIQLLIQAEPTLKKTPNHPKTMSTTKLLLVLFATIVAAACGSTPIGSDSTVAEATVKQLSGDVPLPPGSTIKQQDTLVMSAAGTWLGRISLSVSGEQQAVFTFFKDGMPVSGWTLTSSSFSKTSLLTFTKGERVSNIQIQGSYFGGNEVLITVAPAVRSVNSRP